MHPSARASFLPSHHQSISRLLSTVCFRVDSRIFVSIVVVAIIFCVSSHSVSSHGSAWQRMATHLLSSPVPVSINCHRRGRPSPICHLPSRLVSSRPILITSNTQISPLFFPSRPKFSFSVFPFLESPMSSLFSLLRRLIQHQQHQSGKKAGTASISRDGALGYHRTSIEYVRARALRKAK